MNQGLTTEEAAKKLQTFDYNELTATDRKSGLQMALSIIREPMFILLISCGSLYMIIGDYREGAIMLLSISVIMLITFYQDRKTQRALEALRRLSAPNARVVRDGQEQVIPSRDVVPGDILIVNEGDRICADAVVLDTTYLSVDESLLTGESVSVSKTAFDGSNTEKATIYSGTLVTQGRALCQVAATGVQSKFGKIGATMEQIPEPESPLQHEMKGFIRAVFTIGIGLCLVLIAAFYLIRGNFLQSLLNGLAAAMAILPEEFPVVLTVFLTLGAWRLSRANVLTRKPTAIETLGAITVLCSDKTGTITENRMRVDAVYDGRDIVKPDIATANERVQAILNAAGNACGDNVSDPMEKAILKVMTRPAGTLIKEYPLTRDLLAVTTIRANTAGRTAYVKGAPEAVFMLCQPDNNEREQYAAAVARMAGNGYRVLAVGETALTEDAVPQAPANMHFKLLGLIGLQDLVRAGVTDAVQDCRTAGIKVMMITGDHATTAKAIAAQAGLQPGDRLLTGDAISNMSDEQLAAEIGNVHVCARVSPDQKLRIVRALKANGEIVAMTGDGVNDAPALKLADVGIAMGQKGTDVAREAAALVLLDDNFSSIVAAIKAGRRIFDNLQKAMAYIMAVHIPIIGMTLLPAFIPALPLLLLPLHIVFMELLIDPMSSVAYEYQPEEDDIMKRPPRMPGHKFFGYKRILISVLRGVLLLCVVLGVYYVSTREGHTEKEVRGLILSATIMGNIALVLSGLSQSSSFLNIFYKRNYAALAIVAGALATLCAVMYIPALQALLGVRNPGSRHLTVSLAGAAIVLAVLETGKCIRRQLHKKTPRHISRGA